MKRKRDTTIYARVLVYAPHITWWAEIPETEVVEHLGAAGLHYPYVRPMRLLAGVIGGVGAAAAVGVLSFQLLPTALATPLFLAAAIIGWLGGWCLGATRESVQRQDGRVWFLRSQAFGIDAEGLRTISRSIEPMRYEALKVKIDVELYELITGTKVMAGQMPSPGDDKDGESPKALPAGAGGGS